MSDLFPLRELAELAMGETIIAGDCDGVGFPIFSADTGDAPWNWSSKIKKINEPGTIVIGARGSIGFPRLPAFDAFGATQTTITVTPNMRKVCPEYLYWALSCLDYKTVSVQQAVPMLTVAALGDVLIHCFPLNQQAQIAEIICSVDAAIHKTEAIIAKLKAVKQGLLHDLLSRGISANGELRPPQSEAPHLYKESPLGWIPKEWVVATLNDAVRIVDCKHVTPRYVEDGFPVIRPRNVKPDGLDLRNVERVTARDYKAMTDVHAPKQGDIVLSRNASFGVSAYVDTNEPFAIGQDVIVMTETAVKTKFLFYCLQSSLLSKQIELRSAGSTFGRINLSDIRTLCVPVPDANEQECIVAGLRSLEIRTREESHIAAKLNETRLGLMDDLLTGRVRVTPLLKQSVEAKEKENV